MSGERNKVLVAEPLTESERASLEENGEEDFEIPRGFASRKNKTLSRAPIIPPATQAVVTTLSKLVVPKFLLRVKVLVNTG